MEYWENYHRPFKKKRRKKVTKKKKKKVGKWRLVWMLNHKEKQELIKGSYALCVWKKKVEKLSYPQGELKIIPLE